MFSKKIIQEIFHSFSIIMNGESDNEKKETGAEKAKRKEIENAIIVLVAGVIRLKKNFCEQTEKELNIFFNQNFQIAEKDIRNSINFFIQQGAKPYTRIVCEELKAGTTLETRKKLIHFFFEIASIDEFLNQQQVIEIKQISTYLAITEIEFNQIKEGFLEKGNPYFLIGASEKDSLETIKKAYKKTVLKAHPDKKPAHISQEEADKKFRRILQAYQLILEEREIRKD